MTMRSLRGTGFWGKTRRMDSSVWTAGRKIQSVCLAAGMVCVLSASCLTAEASGGKERSQEEITLRVCNWEEYIDLGDWDEEETIDLDSGDIIGENSMVEDFEEWYYENYGVRVNVEYSTFGTNEDLYNMLTDRKSVV